MHPTATDTPIATAIERTTMTTSPATRDPWDTAPEQVDGPKPSAIEDAFAFTSDRLDRLEHMLSSLNATVMRAGSVLEPILTAGTYDDPNATVTATDPSETTPEDRRSLIARRVSGLGVRADRLATATSYIERTLEAILDATEVRS